MKTPRTFLMRKAVIQNLKIENLIFAEYAEKGAMGNSGGLHIYIYEKDRVVCYECSVFDDEEMFCAVVDFLNKYQTEFQSTDISALGDELKYYSGGMGNHVFIPKNINLEIINKGFKFNDTDEDYFIQCSVGGVFGSVAQKMRFE